MNSRLQRYLEHWSTNPNSELDVSSVKLFDEDIDEFASRVAVISSAPSILLGYQPCLTAVGLRALAGRLPGTKSLKFGSCRAVGDSELRAIVSALPRLLALGIGNTQVTDAGLLAVASERPSLQAVELSGCQRLTDEGIAAFIRCVPRLESLGCRYTNFANSSAEAIADTLAHLISLNVASSKLSDSCLLLLGASDTPIRRIDVSRCKISEENLRFFVRRHAELTSLSIAWQEIGTGTLVEIADLLPNLETLDLSHTNTRTVDFGDAVMTAIASRAPRLSDLRLTMCHGITDQGVRTIAENSHDLIALDIGWMRVGDSALTAIARGLPSLRTLCIDGGKRFGAKALGELGQLYNLDDLSMWGCSELTNRAVGRIVEGAVQIRRLSLAGSHHLTDKALGSIARSLPNLTYLSLSDCASITEEGVRVIAQKATSLENLYVSDCAVSDSLLTDLAHLQLASLYVKGGAGLTDTGVSAFCAATPHIDTLGICGSPSLTDDAVVSISKQCPRITHLILDGNPLLGDSGLKSAAIFFRNLVHVAIENIPNVSESGINELIRTNPFLSRVSLAGTTLRALPNALRSLEYLEWLRLSDSTALGIPEELLQRPSDPKAILAHYFRGTTEGRQRLNEAKVIVVGAEAVGKTSLVNAVVHNRPRNPREPKTPGIAIHERILIEHWNITGIDAGDEEIRLNIWDFGGQEVMYETHRFFLTKRSLYLLVLEARREDDDTVHEWMNVIRNRAGDAPVILVINKAEPPHDLRLDEPRLKLQYPAIVGFIRTSCEPPTPGGPGGLGIQQLRDLIARTVRESLPDVRDWFPTSYFRVKEALTDLARAESVLSTDHYRELCRTHQIHSESEQNALLELLDRIGVVVSHNAVDAPAGMQNTTLLDPNWVTTAVYGLLNHSAIRGMNGEFSFDSLGDYLRSDRYDYPRERWAFIVDIMERFGLCYPLPDYHRRYLIPEQLSPNEPETFLDESDCLRLRFDYDFLPRSLLPRFIVQAHRMMSERRTAWLTGVVLTVEQCRVLVRADRAHRQVQIFVHGPHNRRRPALAVVCNHLDAVHRLNPEINPRAKVPLPDDPAVAADYEWLLQEEADEVEYCRPPGAKRRYHIRHEILDPIGNVPQSEFSPSDLRQQVEIDQRFSPQLTRLKVSDATYSAAPTFPISGSVDGDSILWPSAIAGTALSVFAILVRWNPAHWFTMVWGVFVAVFVSVYVILRSRRYRDREWTKYVVFALMLLIAATTVAPALQLIWRDSESGVLRVVIDNSPWVVAVLMLGAVAFGGMQLRREARDS
jgi:hypothetical protein